MQHSFSRPLLLAGLGLILIRFTVGCAGSITPSSGGSSSSIVRVNSTGIPTGVPEATYYGNVSGSNYVAPDIAPLIAPAANPIQITGTARYYYRNESTGGVQGPTAIRHAEVQIRDSSNRIIIGTETDNAGNFSVNVPANGMSYTAVVTTRAANTYNYVSVLNGPENNQYYTIFKSFVADSSKSIGNIDANVSGAVIGAAFNIYSQVHRAIDYLKANASNCDSGLVGCTNFSALNLVKAHVYWSLGFNPGSYFDASPVSFTTKSDGKVMLFILGGLNGNYISTDSDHWDNSVIIHEYGHFLELAYARMDSPGGPHYYGALVDPRLAWSEGWSNFLQAAVRGQGNYRDMIAMDSGSPTTGINLSLSTQSYGGISDQPQDMGEGVYREFSVARQLWLYLSGSGNSFQELWTVFGNSTVTAAGTSYSGFANSNVSFRNAGRFWDIHQDLFPARSIATITATEKVTPDRSYYATAVALGSGCSSTGALSSGSGSVPGSHPALASRWLEFDHAGGALSLLLTCSSCMSADDYDLYVYRKDHVILDSSTIVGASTTKNSGSFSPEGISGTLAAGKYMIHILRYGGSGSRNFLLQANGQNICPLP